MNSTLDYQITGNWIYLRPAQLLEMLECAADGVVIAPLEELLGVLSERVKEPLSSLDLWEGEALG